jgi:hypothetical protein
MNINTLTVNQCINWLLNHHGYSTRTRRIVDEYDSYWVDARGDRVQFPFPSTIEGANKAIKQPSWFIKKIVFAESYGPDWTVYLRMISDSGVFHEYEISGPDELTARYRATVVSHIWPENLGKHTLT